MQYESRIKEKNERISLDNGQKNKHFSIDKRVIGGEVAVHWHSYFELEIVVDGKGRQFLNDEEYTIKKGCAYLLNPTDFHRIIPETPLVLWNISFDEEMLSERRLCELSSKDMTRKFTLEGESQEKLCSLCEIILSESREESGAVRELCEALLNILLRHSDDEGVIYKSHIEGISRAILYLDVHFRENPSLSQISKQAGFHPTYFSELFKKVTGESYSQRLNTLRSGYAKMLLSKGFSVTEACYQSGFGSLSNFLAVFKKQTGLSPSEYKKTKKST